MGRTVLTLRKWASVTLATALLLLPLSVFSQPQTPAEQTKDFFRSSIEISFLPDAHQAPALRELLKTHQPILEKAINGTLQQELLQSEYAHWFTKLPEMRLDQQKNWFITWLVKVRMKFFGPDFVIERIQNLSDAEAKEFLSKIDLWIESVDPTQTTVFTHFEKLMRNEAGDSKWVKLLETVLPKYFQALPIKARKKQVLAFLDLPVEVQSGAGIKGLSSLLQNSGIYIQKVMQLMAKEVRSPELKAVTTELLSDVHGFPGSEAVKIIEEEFGGKIEDFFSSFELEASKAGTIGQVHKAVLKDTGEEVFVKVLRPGLDEQLEGEYQAIKKAATGTPLSAMPEQLKETIADEKDYRIEGKQTTKGSKLYRNRKEGITTSELAGNFKPSERVLVLKKVKGEAMASLMTKKLSEKELLAIGKKLMDLYELWLEVALFSEEGFIHSDVHAGNVLAELNRKTSEVILGIIDFGNCTTITPKQQEALLGLAMSTVARSPRLAVQSLDKVVGIPHRLKEVVSDVFTTLMKNSSLGPEEILNLAMKELAASGLSIPSEMINFVRARQMIVGQIYEVNSKLGRPEFDLIKVYQNIAFKYAWSPQVKAMLLDPAVLSLLIPKAPTVFRECLNLLSGKYTPSVDRPTDRSIEGTD